MWSDNDIDNAFQRLNPPEPEPTPFPLDAWLRLESQLDKAVIERAVRRRLWQFFAAEVGVVVLIGLGWLLFRPATAPTTAVTTLAGQPVVLSATSAPAAERLTRKAAARAVSASTNNSSSARQNTTLIPTPEVPVATKASSPSGLPQSSSTASPSIPTDATTAQAARSSRPTEAASLPVVSALMPSERSRTKRANAEASVHQQGSVSGFVAANRTRKAARLSHERLAVAGPHAPIASSGEATAKTTSLTAGALPKPDANGRNTAASTSGYSVVGARKQTNARPLSTRMVTATAAANAAQAGSARTPNTAETGSAETNSAASADFAPLALRPVPVPAAEAILLPTPLATVALAETPPQPELPKPAREPRFYVALVGAPDVSTVKFFSIEKPMANVGLVLEYRLTSRLRVNTGLLRADKQYTARREDYDFGANTARVYQRDFTDVEGSCTVFDVPLNLRYDLLVRPRYRVFGSAGLSSFFMQHEDYSYEYPNPSTGVPSYWTGSATNQNRHYFSILNLSAGYERALSSRWSLQAEPYLKLPLAGVGTGKIRLTSAGVFLGVKYGF